MIGATGLVGRQLWPLIANRHDLLVLGRRPSGAEREKLGPATDWPALLEGERVDVAISTLGSTQKKAGSWNAFTAIDRDVVLAFAESARAAGARHFLTVSSVGANASSGNRYLRLKGEVERSLGKIGFQRLDIVRPGLLIGDRVEDHRPLERLGILLSPVLNPLLRRRLDQYRGIGSALVATALAVLVDRTSEGIHIHHNRDIRALANA
jgi:uncharacterized protein YbjT (DUF2867 family)